MAQMNRPKRLVLIRHGESVRNKAKMGSVFFPDESSRALVKGVPDYATPLTLNGHRQAKETGQKLQELFGTPDCVYHSGYDRTIDTAVEILNAYLSEERKHIAVKQSPFIRERDTGYTYDMTEKEAREAFPWLQEYWNTHGGFFARPPGGESLADVANRADNFLNMLYRDHMGETVFAVIHGGTLLALRFLLEDWDYERARAWRAGDSPHNCGSTDYEYEPESGRLVLRNYNTVHWR